MYITYIKIANVWFTYRHIFTNTKEKKSRTFTVDFAHVLHKFHDVQKLIDTCLSRRGSIQLCWLYLDVVACCWHYYKYIQIHDIYTQYFGCLLKHWLNSNFLPHNTLHSAKFKVKFLKWCFSPFFISLVHPLYVDLINKRIKLKHFRVYRAQACMEYGRNIIIYVKT